MRNRPIVLLLILCFLGCGKENFYEVEELANSIEPTIIKKDLYLKIGDDQEYFLDGYAVKSGSAIKISSNPIQCNSSTFDGDKAEEEGDIELELGVIANKVEVINASVYLPGADRVFQLNQVENVQSEINLLSFSEDSISGSVLITNQHDSNFDFDPVVISFSLPIRECNIDYLMTSSRSDKNSISDILEGYAAVTGSDSIEVLYLASFSDFECDTTPNSFGITREYGYFGQNPDSLEVSLFYVPALAGSAFAARGELYFSPLQIIEKGQTLELYSGRLISHLCNPPDMNFNINIEYQDEEIIQGTFEANYYLLEEPEKQGDCTILTFYDHFIFSFRMNFKTCG